MYVYGEFDDQRSFIQSFTWKNAQNTAHVLHRLLSVLAWHFISMLKQ